jgi:hypothetical protein
MDMKSYFKLNIKVSFQFLILLKNVLWWNLFKDNTRIISESGKKCDKGEEGNQTVAVYAYILVWVIFNGLLKMKE